jgi:hypothetical protein
MILPTISDRMLETAGSAHSLALVIWRASSIFIQAAARMTLNVTNMSKQSPDWRRSTASVRYAQIRVVVGSIGYLRTTCHKAYLFCSGLYGNAGLSITVVIAAECMLISFLEVVERNPLLKLQHDIYLAYVSCSYRMPSVS